MLHVILTLLTSQSHHQSPRARHKGKCVSLLRLFSTLRGTAFGEATGDVRRCGVSDYVIATRERCIKCGPDSPELLAPPFRVPVRYEKSKPGL